jgi:phytoene dehydrogenase-like protein
MQQSVAQLEPTWGAFMLYLGVDANALPHHTVDHHQVIGDHTQPLGETNSIFISMSPPSDTSRAPEGMRAVNISTHTDIGRWWHLRNDPDRKDEYHAQRDRYTEQMIALAERAIPGFAQAVRLTLPATPVTYAHWTGRERGMVGGFPQGSLFKARGPRTEIENVWLVGDSIFPGQSTAGVTLGGMRVAHDVIRATKLGK